MPANLTPEYRAAEQQFTQAKTPAEKLCCASNPDPKIRRRESYGHSLLAMGETHLPDVCGEHHSSEVGGKGRRS